MESNSKQRPGMYLVYSLRQLTIKGIVYAWKATSVNWNIDALVVLLLYCRLVLLFIEAYYVKKTKDW